LGRFTRHEGARGAGTFFAWRGSGAIVLKVGQARPDMRFTRAGVLIQRFSGGAGFIGRIISEVRRDGLNGAAVLAATDAAREGFINREDALAMSARQRDHGFHR
jgi:hypothetical protein